MKLHFLVSSFLLGFLATWPSEIIGSNASFSTDFGPVVDSLREAMNGLKAVIRKKNDVMKMLAVQTMRNQIQHEDRIRAEGGSGIVQTRNLREGSKNYHSSTATGYSFASMYDLTMSRQALGMGEVFAVMNGVEFRTRRSDYSMMRPSTTSSDWMAVEAITPPPVPPSVASKATVQEQVVEMAEYFKAFKLQDKSIRDYSNYFKPVLCYMEAAWMADTQNLEDLFESERIQLSGNSWNDLHQRYRAEVVMGVKDKAEGNAHLPTTITHIDEQTGEPVYAQWNYRQLCHPIDQDLPTRHFKQINDVAFRTARNISKNDVISTRGAHFTLDDNTQIGYREKGLLNRLISKIPGLDNIPSQLTMPVLGNTPEKDVVTGDVINLGYYNHWYDIGYHNGYSSIPRGFSDPNLYVAATTQSRVAPIPVSACDRKNVCQRSDLKVSYLIPLEVVYMTPLTTWNPHGLKDFVDDDGAVFKGGKNGKTASVAYHGISNAFFFQTPSSFFRDWKDESVPGDKIRRPVWVKDTKGKPQEVIGSGQRTILPYINGVGEVRTRYPISPLHYMGSPVWKELSAVKDSLNL